jgi:hypothetical protein
MPQRERVAGLSYLLKLAIEGDSTPPSPDLARMAERALGVSAGRRRLSNNLEPWLTGPATEISQSADMISLPAIAAVAQTVTLAELEEVRDYARALTLLVPQVLPLAQEWFRDQNVAGLGNLVALADPDIAPYIVAVLVGIRRDPALWTNIREVAEAARPFLPLAQQLMGLRILDAAELDRRLQLLPAATRSRLKDVLARLWTSVPASQPPPST